MCVLKLLPNNWNRPKYISEFCIQVSRLILVLTKNVFIMETLNIFKGVLPPYFEFKEIKENIINFRGFKTDIVS